MHRWMIKLRPLALGGVTLGWLAGLQGVNFNQVWFEFLITWLTVLVSLLFGEDPTTLMGSGAASLT